MPTLKELAAARAARSAEPPPSAAAPQGAAVPGGAAEKKTSGGMVLRAGDPLPSRPSAGSFGRKIEDHGPAQPDLFDRLLGTENLADVIPNFPVRGPGPEREWEQTSLLPASSLGMILDSTTRTAWLACSRPGMPPLLIHPFPILGRLTGEPLEPANAIDQSPCATSHGSAVAPERPPASRPTPAPPAG